ncbi:MAG: DUF4431 domain-containing protein [Proteobacteria bacterium]|nr:DUF4431 domain-containing protein [Pseudomonadota bacterium]
MTAEIASQFFRWMSRSLILIILFTSPVLALDCVRTDAKITLSGSLSRQLFSSPFGGEDEQTLILKLRSPICLAGDDFSDPNNRFDRVQLYSTVSSITKALNATVGTDVTVEGNGFGAHTGHHHAPLVLEVTEINISSNETQEKSTDIVPANANYNIQTGDGGKEAYLQTAEGARIAIAGCTIQDKRMKFTIALLSAPNAKSRLKKSLGEMENGANADVCLDGTCKEFEFSLLDYFNAPAAELNVDYRAAKSTTSLMIKLSRGQVLSWKGDGQSVFAQVCIPQN